MCLAPPTLHDPRGLKSISALLCWIRFPGDDRPDKGQSGIALDVEGWKPVRFSRPYRAERVFLYTQAKAWAEFSWPYGPQAGPARKPRSFQGFCGPKGQESTAQALAWVRSLAATALKGRRKTAQLRVMLDIENRPFPETGMGTRTPMFSHSLS